MAEISKKTAQQIVDSVKDVCGHDVNFIQSAPTMKSGTAPRRKDSRLRSWRTTASTAPSRV